MALFRDEKGARGQYLMAYATGIEQNLVSVIVPAHNAEKFLAEALASILAQDYRPIEVIVVDDGSTDGTATIAQAYTDVRYVFQKKQGAAAARNAGLAICSGALIAFLDADDLWVPNKLSRQSAYLDEHPEAVCVSGKTFLSRKRNVLPGLNQALW
jgi:glycosyltransferase involved in cell wall biosynthesis